MKAKSKIPFVVNTKNKLAIDTYRRQSANDETTPVLSLIFGGVIAVLSGIYFDSSLIWAGVFIAAFIGTALLLASNQPSYTDDVEYSEVITDVFEITAMANGRESESRIRWSGSGALTFVSMSIDGQSESDTVFRFVRKHDRGYSTIESIRGSGDSVRIFEDSEDGRGYVCSMAMGIPDAEYEKIVGEGKCPRPFCYSRKSDDYEWPHTWTEIHVPKGTVRQGFSLEA